MKFFAALLLAALSLTAAETQARTITDAAGRKVEIPDTVKRVLAAGPPASVLVYVLSPD